MSSFCDGDLTQMQPCKASDDFLIRVALFSPNFAKPAFLAVVWRQKPDGMATGAKRLREVTEQAEVETDFELLYPGSARDVRWHVSRNQLHKRRLAHCGFLRYVGEGEDHRWWECKWWWWWR